MEENIKIQIFPQVWQCYYIILHSAPVELSDFIVKALRIETTITGYEICLDSFLLQQSHMADNSKLEKWFETAAKSTAEYLSAGLGGSLEEL